MRDLYTRARRKICAYADQEPFDAKPLTAKQIGTKLAKIKKQSEALLIGLMVLEPPACDVLNQTIAAGGRSSETGCIVPAGTMESDPHRPTLGEIMVYLQRLADAAASPIIRRA